MDINEMKKRVEKLGDFEHIKDKLFVELSPINEVVMENSPHRIVEDLMLTYHIYIPDESGGFLSARVTNSMLESYGISPETLHRETVRSTPHILGPKVMGLAEAVILKDDDRPIPLVVSNRIGVYGAGSLFVDGMMDAIAVLVGGNYFILPSSRHELIIVPEALSDDVAELHKMVEKANKDVVNPEAYLSDSVYHYDKEACLFETADSYETRKTIGA